MCNYVHKQVHVMHISHNIYVNKVMCNGGYNMHFIFKLCAFKKPYNAKLFLHVLEFKGINI